MKHIVAFSGGESSALCAIHCAEKYGTSNLILLNHNISSKVEHEDIKRFKQEVANFIGLKITYANHPDYENMTPCKLCKNLGVIGNPTNHQALCTYYLKTKPFYDYLAKEFPIKSGIREDWKLVYGFNKNEEERITRRVGILGSQGYECYFPSLDKDFIASINHYGIKRPVTYKLFKHANCIGCLKAGKQHWYITYCLRSDIFEEALELENELPYTILKDTSMKDLIPFFEDVKSKGICPNEHDKSFWQKINNVIPEQTNMFPCECSF